MIELPSPLAVICHDAGAANIILSWLDDHADELRPFMAGPAARLWAEKFGDRPLVGSLEEALDGAAAVLTGTGWASTLEHDARRLARLRGIPSAAVIDHWVNYAERFERNGEVVWPDEFWVTDDDAQRLAAHHFPGEVVRVKPNPYLRAQVDGMASPEASSGVLYVLEPARNTWGREEQGEFQALAYFLANLECLGLDRQTEVRLRPHPSDPEGKYAHVVERHGNVSLDRSSSLKEAIGQSAWVVGMESFALVVALHAGRRVVTTLPPWAPPCRLPHKGLIRLKDLASK